LVQVSSASSQEKLKYNVSIAKRRLDPLSFINVIGFSAEFPPANHIAENTIFGTNTENPWLLQHDDTALFWNVN